MAERGNVIEGLTRIYLHFDAIVHTAENYRDFERYEEMKEFTEDALSFLEEQEPKERKWIDHLYRFNDTRFECGSCHRTSWKNTPFCPWCGLKMTGTEIDKDFSEGAGK